MMAELKAEALREAERESDEEYWMLELLELEVQGSYSADEILDLIDGKPVFVPNWY